MAFDQKMTPLPVTGSNHLDEQYYENDGKKQEDVPLGVRVSYLTSAGLLSV